MTTIRTKREQLALTERRLRPKASYNAGRSGRRLHTWRAPSGGPNALLLGQLDTLRARSRDSIRNNGWISHGLDSLVANEIGTGIVPRSQAPDEAFRAAADALWADWIADADADGLLDFYGLLALAVRSRREAGEVFVRRRTRRPEDGLAVPLQLQLLESEHCPLHYNEGKVRAGIEFDAIGRRSRYWMYREHPGEHLAALDSSQLAGVPADSIIHHYAPLRPGQLRGQPWTVQALIRARDFDEYDDAELNRKKTRSSYTGVIKRPDYGDEDYQFDPFTGEPLATDSDGVGITTTEPGSFPALLPGEEITLFDGDPTGQGYADFVRQQLLGMAAGLGVPYEVLSGDYRNVNDRVMRVILNEYHRILEQSQWLLTIPQICNRVWGWFIDHAVMAGALKAPDYAARQRDYRRVEWRTDGWPYMHPVQDVQSKLMAIGGGLESRQAAVAERGWSVEDVDRQNAEDAARAREHGLSYSHDPGNLDDDTKPA